MMKSLFACAALAFCALTSSTYAQGAAYAIKAINVSLPKTPDFTVTNPESKRFTPGTWVEIEVEFSSAPVLSPELEFKYYLLVGGQCLTGDITHVNVPAGQSLFSVMYVAPRTMTALLKGQPLSAASVQNAAVQIMKPGAPQPLAERMLKPGAPFFRTMQQVPGMMLTKAETPFAMLAWDRYEATKPAR